MHVLRIIRYECSLTREKCRRADQELSANGTVALRFGSCGWSADSAYHRTGHQNPPPMWMLRQSRSPKKSAGTREKLFSLFLALCSDWMRRMRRAWRRFIMLRRAGGQELQSGCWRGVRMRMSTIGIGVLLLTLSSLSSMLNGGSFEGALWEREGAAMECVHVRGYWD